MTGFHHRGTEDPEYGVWFFLTRNHTPKTKIPRRIWRRTVAQNGGLPYTQSMEEFIDALVRWLHLLAAVIFIGPQIFLAFVAMPALRSIEDARARQGAVRAITRGFGVLSGVALAALLVTGIYNYYQFEDLIDADNFPRYFFLIQIKLTLVTIVIALTVLHGAFFGRRLQQLQQSGASEAELAGARRWSMLASMLNLAASVVILLIAAMMSSDWSKL